MKLDYIDLFNTIMPGFLQREGIRALPPEEVYDEQILDLHSFSADDYEISCPEHITFDFYKGDLAGIHEAVKAVEDGWISCYTPDSDIYCAFDGDRIVSFCLVDEFGTYNGIKIGGPGCVGTIPEYRRQGIGLKMVQKATEILKERGYDLSYIHYTGVGHWYAKLGYETIVKWNSEGIVG